MNPSVRLTACTALLVAALAGPPPVLAEWPSSPTIGVPVCVAPGTQSAPRMSADGGGGAFFAWLDARLGWNDQRAYLQHLSAPGNPSYATDGVPLSAYVVPEFPAITSDGAGGAFVVWRDFRADTAGNLYVQRLAPSDPALLGTNGLPVCLGPLHETHVQVAPDEAGGLFVAWFDDRDGPTGQVRAQHMSAAGALLWDAAGLVVAPGAAR